MAADNVGSIAGTLETLNEVSQLCGMTGDSMLARGQLPEGGAALKLLSSRIAGEVDRLGRSPESTLKDIEPTVAPLLERIEEVLRARLREGDTLSSLALNGIIGRMHEVAELIRVAHGNAAIERALVVKETPTLQLDANQLKELIAQLTKLLPESEQQGTGPTLDEMPTNQTLPEQGDKMQVTTPRGLGIPFERFTNQSQKVMALANQEAQRLNHEYIGTEHILLGLIRNQNGIGLQLLRSAGLDPNQIRTEIGKLVAAGPEMITMGKLPQTPRAKKVVELAVLTARDAGHGQITTGHLLAGLIKEQNGVAAQVLHNMGLDSVKLLSELTASDLNLTE